MIASELQRIREELNGLRDSISQIVYGTKFIAPEFLFSESGPVIDEDVQAKAQSLLTEFGSDYGPALKKLRRYSESFFLDYVGAVQAADNTPNLDTIKLAIQCEQTHTPFQDTLFKVYQADFRAHYKDANDVFRNLCGSAELIVLHLSCRPNALIANESVRTFFDSDSRMQNLIVVGHASGAGGNYHLNPENRVLTVPASDAYDGLAQKSAAAFAFLAFMGNSACVLKVDDDIRCLEPARILDDALPLVRSHDYVGRVIHAGYGFSRFWHLGKCQDPVLNAKPYGLLANASYAEGPAYFLSPRMVHLLGKSSVYLEQLFETENGYEDVAVGKVLNNYGFMPVYYDPIRRGLLASTDNWMMERVGLNSIT